MNMSVAEQPNFVQVRSSLFDGLASHGLFRALTLFQVATRNIPTPVSQIDQKDLVFVKRIDRGRGNQFCGRRLPADNQADDIWCREEVEIPRDLENSFPM
jgi:hypothetical protein